jgi:hypothetical protein
MLRRALVIVAAAVAAGTAAAQVRTPFDAGCQPRGAHTPKVGKVTRASGQVHQGKNFVTSGTALLTNGTLCTGDEGFTRFTLDQPNVASCELRPAARIRLYPPKLNPAHLQVIVRFEDGVSYCSTGTSPSAQRKKYDARKGQVRILLADPLFGVDVDPDRTVVKVALGYLDVSKLAGGGAVIVGPGQQVTIPELQEPGQVAPLDETPEDKAAFNDLRGTVPRPSFRPPAVDGSAVLKRIFGRHSIIVALDRDHLADENTAPFVQRFFSFLAKSWGLKLSPMLTSTQTLVSAVRSGKFDVGLTSDVNSIGELGSLPLFADSNGDVWSMVVQPDKVFLNGLAGFIRSAVIAGTYGGAYRLSFRQEPSYEPLRPVLFG